MGPEIGLGLSAISTISGVAGGLQQGSANAASAKYQAQVARNNAVTAQRNAEYAVQAGETQAQAQDFKNRSTLGSIAAAQSASGLSFDSPTLRDVREGAANVLRLDTANIAQNAALRARAYQAQGTEYTAEAGLQESKAKDASRAGTMTAFGSLLSGASGFADKWTKFYPTSPTKVL